MNWSSIVDANCYDFKQSNLGSLWKYHKHILLLDPHNKNIIKPRENIYGINIIAYKDTSPLCKLDQCMDSF
jgi:hypothetical protein